MKRQIMRSLVLAALLVVVPAAAFAGGPLLLNAPGQPYRWGNGGLNIPFNPDQGGLGPMNNTDAVAQTTAAFAEWQAIPSARATHVNAGLLPVDVDETNYAPFLDATAPDGLSAIVYDEDGAIFTELFGPNSGVLGFASPEWVNTATATIVEGFSFLNGGSLLGAGAFPVAEFLSVQVHEYGHYQNMAHTVINGQIAGFGDSRGPSPFNTFPPVNFFNRIETMYPFLFIGGGQATVHADDVAFFSFLYPEPAFAATTGTISGSVLASNGVTPITGVNIIARNIANPYEDAVSAISSDFTDSFGSGPFVGAYTIRGLTPGASYAVYIDTIIAGGFSTPPRNPLPGPEEFYNGPNETGSAVTDNPSEFTPVITAAGGTSSGINILINGFPPGTIPAGDDSTTEIFPNVPIRLCGQDFSSIFVNSNGNLTFGAGNTDFSESIAENLTGPVRISGLWDDLNPATRPGSVTWSQTADSVTVNWTNVPEFGTTNSNTFSITIYAPRRGGDDDDDDDDGGGDSSSRFEIKYGALAAPDGISGCSCGGRVTSGFEQEVDLTTQRRLAFDARKQTAVFEAFTALDNDLDNLSLSFEGPEAFNDQFRNNDTIAATRGDDDDDDDGGSNVSLPFDTASKFSDISPQGGDVDYYRFTAKAGDILVAETVPGNLAMDTILGLFDARTGQLLFADDDSGVGLLSRFGVQLAADGEYAVAVSTFPDFAFTGAGGDRGRYVLNLATYRGTILPVSDDGSVPVTLNTFQFPFQGTNWSRVFVNGNGNLTFGTGSSDFAETVTAFLSGPPRIAALWDDLFPPNGLVIAEEKDRKLKVHYVSVPEFIATGTNYVTVTLDRKGNVTMDYQVTNRSDGIVGVTRGGGAADPGPTDLSAAKGLNVESTVYERFAFPVSFSSYGGVDFSYDDLKFRKPGEDDDDDD